MGITLLVYKENAAYDMSDLVQIVKWGGRKSAMPRSIEVTMLDSDRHGHERPDIQVQRGDMVLFQWNGKELFRGIFVNVSQSQSRTASYKAYDAGMYLAKNMGTFTFEKKTGTQVFASICNEFELEYEAVDTQYVIPNLTKPNTTAADVIWAALAKTYRATGGRFYVLAQEGKLRLIARADNVLQLVVEEGGNAISFTREQSIENVYTRVTLYSDANEVVASAVDNEIEAKLGVMQYTEQADTKDKKADNNTKAKNLLSIKKQSEETLEVEVIGDDTVYSGVAIYLSIPYLGIEQTYFVDEDEHEFKGEMHTMRLKLNAVNDVQGADENDDDE